MYGTKEEKHIKSAIIKGMLAESWKSTKWLAKESGVSYQYLCNLLSQKPRSEPSPRFLGKISSALNVKPWEICEGIESIPTKPKHIEKSSPRHLLRGWMIKRINHYSPEERAQIWEVVEKVINLLTTEREPWRKRNIAIIKGFLDIYFSVLDPLVGQVGGEGGKLLTSEENNEGGKLN